MVPGFHEDDGPSGQAEQKKIFYLDIISKDESCPFYRQALKRMGPEHEQQVSICGTEASARKFNADECVRATVLAVHMQHTFWL
jgi:hypothetical protein